MAGLVVAGALWLLARGGEAARASLLAFLVALGLLVGGRLEERRSGERARVAEEQADGFSTVRLDVEDDWAPRSDGAWRLKARAFELLDEEGVAYPMQARIHVLLYDQAPEIGTARRIVARGFLRPLDEGAYALSVKATTLVTPEGEASRFDPRSWNRWLARRIEAAAGGSDAAREGSALAQALVLGRGALVPWETIDVYQRGGTYHLLVFSGVQIAMMAALVRWILVRLRMRRAADAALLLICALMPRFVGADPSVSRSALMIGLLIGCWLWERPTDAANLVFVSALVRLVLVPEDLTDPGFALTYSATAGILVVGRTLAAGRGRVGKPLAYGLGAELGTTPFTLFFFHRATIGGSVVTLLVSPIVTVMLVMGLAAAVLSLSSPEACRMVLEWIALLNHAVLWVNRFVAEGARFSIVAAAPLVSVIACASAAAVAAASKGSLRGDLAVALLLLVPLGSAAARSRPDTDGMPIVRVLDVGQGDATLATSRGRAILIDGGGSSSDPAFGTRTLLPLLAESGGRSLDAVVLSHPHPDHCAGLAAVMRDLQVARLILSKRHLATDCGALLVDAAMRRGVPVEAAERAGRFHVGEIEVEVFGTSHRYRRAWENNSSTLVRLTAEGRRVLLTGDIEREAEMVLVEQEAARLGADVLKVPHHGSRSSTTPRFVAAVGPRIAFISSGVRNRFGHPHDEPLATLEAAGVRIEKTATAGTLTFQLSEDGIFVHREFDSGRSGP